MSSFNTLKLYLFNRWVLSIVIAFATVSASGSAIQLGLDASYKFAFNYFFIHNIQIGKDILFTLGPLGFIYEAMPLGDNILIATIVTLILKFIFVLTSISLYIKVRNDSTLVDWTIFIVITYIVSSGIGVHHVILFIPILLILIYTLKPKLYYILLSAMIAALALLIKSSTGITILLAFTSFSIYSIYKKNYQDPLVLFLTMIATFLLIWFSLYHSLTGIYEYFYATLEFSRGNSTAMTLNPDNNWLIFTLFFFFFITYPLLNRDKLTILYYGITILTTMAIFKFAMSREDHIFEFENYLFDFSYILFVISPYFTLKKALHILLTYITFLAFIYVTPWGYRIKGRLIQTHFIQQPFKNLYLLNVNKLTNYLQNVSINNLKPRVLDKNITTLIGNATIDSYPNYTTYFAANTLNWKPRPVFQSYITYTSYLDNVNARFYSSKQAPEFILWSNDGPLRCIDGRYLLNDSPATLLAILNHYIIYKKTKRYILLKKSSRDNLSTEVLGSHTYKWNTWIDVPHKKYQDNNTFLLAKTFLKRTLLQKMKKLVYKEFEVFIEYRYNDGSVTKHRLVVDTTQAGVWVGPYLNKLFGNTFGKEVKSIRFTHHRYDFFKDKFDIQWEARHMNKPFFELKNSRKIAISPEIYTNDIIYHIDKFLEGKESLRIQGWCFIKGSKIDKTTKYIVLKNTQNTISFTTSKQLRADVTKHFRAANLENSGFAACIFTSDIPPGKYTINLLLVDQKGKKSMISLDKHIDITK